MQRHRAVTGAMARGDLLRRGGMDAGAEQRRGGVRLGLRLPLHAGVRARSVLRDENEGDEGAVTSKAGAASLRAVPWVENCPSTDTTPTCYDPAMAGSAWSWRQTAFGWWEGEREGFEGTVSVFERTGSWCVRVHIRWCGSVDLCHFSEGYVDVNAAKRAAGAAASRALAIRVAPIGGKEV